MTNTASFLRRHYRTQVHRYQMAFSSCLGEAVCPGRRSGRCQAEGAVHQELVVVGVIPRKQLSALLSQFRPQRRSVARALLCYDDTFRVVVEAPNAFSFLGSMKLQMESALRMFVQHSPEHDVNLGRRRRFRRPTRRNHS